MNPKINRFGNALAAGAIPPAARRRAFQSGLESDSASPYYEQNERTSDVRASRHAIAITGFAGGTQDGAKDLQEASQGHTPR
jgi:hypothetical protein